jgi:hypothetical protein
MKGTAAQEPARKTDEECETFHAANIGEKELACPHSAWRQAKIFFKKIRMGAED